MLYKYTFLKSNIVCRALNLLLLGEASVNAVCSFHSDYGEKIEEDMMMLKKNEFPESWKNLSETSNFYSKDSDTVWKQTSFLTEWNESSVCIAKMWL